MSMVKGYIKWLWNESYGIRWRMFVDCLLGLVRVASGLLFIYASKILVDMATHRLPSSPRLFYFYAISLVVLLVIELGSNIFDSWFGNQTEIKMKNRIRQALFRHLMTMRWDGKDKLHSGDMMNRLEEDARVVTNTICSSLPSVIVTAIQLTAAFLFLCTMNKMLAWTLLLIMPIFLFASKIYMKTTRRQTKEIRTTDSRVQSLLQESLQHNVVIRSMERSETMVDRLRDIQYTLYAQIMHRTRFTLFSRGMVSIGFSTGYLIAFLWGVVSLRDGVISVGVMTAFLQLVNQIQRPMVDISRQIPAFIHATTSIDRLRELESFPVEDINGSIFISGKVGIRISHVTYSYPDGKHNVLSDFSYDFTPGSKTAILGETGVGKSTTIRLILALLQPVSGTISLYNDAGQELSASAKTRCNIDYVPQGNSLLSGTVRENLLLGNLEATEPEMNQALHTAAADFVFDLPDGIDTLCGEQGAGLSEGQAQRIAIARSLLRHGSVMLLDEFSSSLDRATEQTLVERLLSECHDKTIIFITHREMILNYCDRVIKLSKENKK
jgi:ATP-binding cassette, subfamily B, bacterial